MQYCTKCGKPVTGAFCTNCGAPVSNPKPAAPAPAARNQMPVGGDFTEVDDDELPF